MREAPRLIGRACLALPCSFLLIVWYSPSVGVPAPREFLCAIVATGRPLLRTVGGGNVARVYLRDSTGSRSGSLLLLLHKHTAPERRLVETQLDRPANMSVDVLDQNEQWWAAHQPWLLSRGYMLRRRYRPGWKPSWHGRDILSLEVEDGQTPGVRGPLFTSFR